MVVRLLWMRRVVEPSIRGVLALMFGKFLRGIIGALAASVCLTIQQRPLSRFHVLRIEALSINKSGCIFCSYPSSKTFLKPMNLLPVFCCSTVASCLFFRFKWCLSHCHLCRVLIVFVRTKTKVLPHIKNRAQNRLRNHWFWMNGVAIPGDSQNVLTYVIWKDYNCQTWETISILTEQGNSFISDQYTAMNTFEIGSNIVNDVWTTAHDFVEYAQGNAAFSSGALSIIMTTHPDAIFRGYICTINKKYREKNYLFSDDGVNYYGSYFLFQTR